MVLLFGILGLRFLQEQRSAMFSQVRSTAKWVTKGYE